jgi:septal ring factor EnvC (AmiA/AmiB activator)
VSENKTPVTPQQKKVYLYIIVLFTAAFLLILWSFFATHRSNQQVLDEVRGNADVVESALEENQALSERNKVLEDENDRLRAELAAALMREVQLKNDLTNATDDLSALEQQLAELLPEGLPAGN